MTAADRTEARAASLRKRSSNGELARKTALGELLTSTHGRRFLWDVLTDANVFAQTYVMGSFDATAFQEGKRAAGNKLLADILRLFPASYIQMTKENSSVSFAEQPEEQEQDDE